VETTFPEDNAITTHSQARTQTRALLRRNAFEVASRILMHEGAGALTVRRIAQELECSTKVIYTLFGNKDGLANELYREGYARLRQALGQVPHAADPALYLAAIGQAYWEFALANPSYYEVMFGGAIPDFTPDEVSMSAMRASLGEIVQTVRQYIDQGSISEGDPVLITQSLWTLLHGIVSLRLIGHFADLSYAQTVLHFSLDAWLAGLLHPNRS
jgi:AcrR family transcriptional regulator